MSRRWFCLLVVLLVVGGISWFVHAGLRSPPGAARRGPFDPSRRSAYPGCEAFGAELCDVRDERCQAELFGLVRCLYGAGPASPPRVTFAPRAVFLEDVRRRERELLERRAPLEWAAARLGLHGGRSDAPGAVTGGYYRPKTRDIVMLADRATSSGLSATLTLAHELLHALQDRDGALRRVLESERGRSVDHELALRAAIEGEASAYAELLQALHGKRVLDFRDERWLERLARAADAADVTPLARLSALDAALGDFGYAYGAYWAATALGRGAPLEIDRASRDAAFDSRGIMSERHGWAREIRAATCPSGERLGAWLVQAYVLVHTKDAERARAAARATRGDCLSVELGRRLVWETHWSSERAAHAFAELLELQQGHSGLTHTVSVEGSRATLDAAGAERPSVTSSI
jgi:hypothetical protein